MSCGSAINDAATRPIFILRQSSKDELPSDLKGLLYVEYGIPTNVTREQQVELLVEDFRGKFGALAELANLSNRPHGRFSGASYIARKLGRLQLKPKEVKAIQSAFPTVDFLQSATAESLGQKTGLDSQTAQAVAQVFRATLAAEGAVS